ncbi:MAG TPA: hypothetical protein VG204_13145 [Terriglobia bacterium]|nr:hypothetical protein [Terriglobia bacterium]
MQNVALRLDETIILHIRKLRGELVGTATDMPATFDDKHSFMLHIFSAEIGISAAHLSDLMNRYVFAYPRSPLSNIKVGLEGDRIKESGLLRKGVVVPFEVEGRLEATPAGKIRMRAASVKSAHVPVKKLIHLFGLDVADLIDYPRDHGFWLEGDDLVLDPDRMIPAPAVRGKVIDVHIEGDQLIEVFGPRDTNAAQHTRPLSPPRTGSNGYMYFRGGTLRFGKLTMADADLEIVDADATGPFYFYLDRYNDQLVAGYSKTTPDHGLVVVMPDFNKMGKLASEPGSTAQ